MIPTLPTNDPDPARRRARLYASRETYRFAHIFPSPALPRGVAVAEEVPPRDNFTLDIVAQVLRVEGLILANQAASDFGEGIDDALNDRPSRPRLSDFAALRHVARNRRFLFAAPTAAARRVSESFPADVASYERLFALIRKPEVVLALDRGGRMQDRVFAWQRIAGAAPVHLRAVTTPRSGAFASRVELRDGIPFSTPPGHLPATFALDDAIYRRAMGDGDSLDRAIAEHRLYVCDYRLFHGIEDGHWGRGRKKHTFAPIAAFAWRAATALEPGELVPVAIQCHQEDGGSERNPVLTPKDGARWMMARTIVQSSDGQAQELVYHLARTHMIVEAVVVAAHRSLDEQHPLMVLLAPHLAFTLAINDHAVHSLIAPGGQVEQVFGKTLAGSLEVLARALAETRFDELAVPADLAARGVADRTGLGVYPWRDDALELWPAMERFVARYLALYYAGDADVIGDAELAAFVDALAAPDAGGLRGVPRPTDLASLTRFVTTLIWTASAQHACLNYAQFPMMGYVVNMPAAVYADAPTAQTPDDPSQWKALLPPAHMAAVQFSTLYELSAVRHGRLGEYPAFHFVDPRVGAILADYRSELERVETVVTGADRSRLLSYPYLRPSQIGQSIFI